MSSSFLSSEEYDERAHQQYNEGNYDGALVTLHEGLALYPNAVELHVGLGYARLARDEFAWARRSFEEALVLDPEHEDGLAGLGETLLRFGQTDAAKRIFARVRALGYEDDIELMQQIGRALFRDDEFEEALEFFEVAVRQAPDSAEAVGLVGYAQHRLGQDDAAVETLRRALKLEPAYTEARIYLGNLLYDRGEYEAALYQLDQTQPEDHWDELGIWRLLELRKSHLRLPDGDPSFEPWEARLAELAPGVDPVDEMLTELETRFNEQDEREAREQLELFGSLLGQLSGDRDAAALHRVEAGDGRAYDGTWDEIVDQMRESSAAAAARTAAEFMQSEARRGHSLTGRLIPAGDAESFLRGCADAGLLRIVR
ncbi:MAG: tetratricopeptide repeat protein [Gemmatimonadetes bacterium]|nr:tetratricopeptide repeat protein [Gemmatimonadota bacterium]